MLVTCFSTARCVMNMRSPIAWFERPSAISSSTSRSRGVRSCERVVLAPPPDELRDDLGVERRAALAHAPHGVGELGDVRDAVLQQVADALGALGEQVERVLGLDVLREHEHAGAGMLLADLARGAQPLVGVRRRHADVDERDVRAVRAHLQHQLVGRPGLPDDVEPGLLEQSRDPLAEQNRIVGENDAHGPV